MTNREARGLAQYQISQKRIDAMAAWIDEIFPETRDKLIQDFMSVYEEMLSTLGEKQKSAPADLYKLGSYWELHKNSRETLQTLGEEISVQINEQLHQVYIEVYEGCRPGEEKTCRVSKKTIQKAIEKSRGKAARNSQECIWLNMTVLWDRLLGDLMHCTIKNLPAKKLLSSLQDQFDKAMTSLKTSCSDSATYVQVRAVIRRSKDDRMAAAANVSEETSAPVPMMMSARGIFGDWEADEGYGDEGEDGDEETEEGQEDGRVMIYVEWDDLVCEPCADLDGTVWDEDIYGDCPVPVHPNCRCWVEEAPPNPFDDMADAIADNGFSSLGGMLLSMVVVGALTIAGRMWDDLLSGGMSPSAWLSKWGDRYPV
jgi:hypothetical protein